MLSPYWQELYEERAGIKEFDGKMPRVTAEKLAMLEIEGLMRAEQGRLEF